MPKVITAPDKLDVCYQRSVFLAGGITNCPDWQSIVIDGLKNTSLTIFNPRRSNFDVNNPDLFEEQVTWEYEALHKANFISFWFCEETLNPITLYELGFWNNSRTHSVVGIHPGYVRKKDVELQTRLAQGCFTKIVDNLEFIAYNIKKYFGEV